MTWVYPVQPFIAELENMTYRNYYFWLIVRIILLLVNVFLTGSTVILIGKRDILFMPLILFIILIVQVVDFIYFTTRTNREIARFITHLNHQDLSEKFDEKSIGQPFKKLYRAFNKMIGQMDKIILEKEAQYGYLQQIVRHITIGIISVKENHEIVLINEPAKVLLGIKEKTNWSEIRRKNPEFVSKIDRIKGKGSRLIEIKIDNELRHLSVNLSTLVLMGKTFRIITFQDIRNVIEQKEIEAWHKLIQILRHEIMNSVTPIASMTDTIVMLVEDQLGHAKKLNDIQEKDIEDIRESIKTIRERSEGLYKFVENYRDLTKIPPPKIESIRIQQLFESIKRMMHSDLQQYGIQLITEIKNKDLTIRADQSLIEQVLINLISNSIHALEKTEYPEIRLLAEKNQNAQIIRVTDNGIGIEEKNLEEAFVPFYTTKDDGSGIGLSISRQIMHLHGGYITADSDPGNKTEFCLIFPV